MAVQPLGMSLFSHSTSSITIFGFDLTVTYRADSEAVDEEEDGFDWWDADPTVRTTVEDGSTITYRE